MMIRILQESDARAYQETRLAALKMNPEAYGSTYEREAAFSLETFEERIRPGSDKFVLGAFDDHGLVGIVSFVRESGFKMAHKGNVYAMYVSPAARGKGVGKKLMLELIRKAGECEGLEQIHLAVVSDNEFAKRLYRSVGFEVYGTEPNALKFNGKYYDEDLMVLQFSKSRV